MVNLKQDAIAQALDQASLWVGMPEGVMVRAVAQLLIYQQIETAVFVWVQNPTAGLITIDTTHSVVFKRCAFCDAVIADEKSEHAADCLVITLRALANQKSTYQGKGEEA